MKRYGRVDQNEKILIELFEVHGCHVHRCADFGNGFPDLMVGFRDKIALVEVKRGKNTLTPDQVTFHAIWPVFVAREVKDVQEICQWLKRSHPARKTIETQRSAYGT